MYPQSFTLIYGFLFELWVLNLKEEENNYRQKLSMFGRIAVSPPEKRGIPGCMLVP